MVIVSRLLTLLQSLLYCLLLLSLTGVVEGRAATTTNHYYYLLLQILLVVNNLVVVSSVFCDVRRTWLSEKFIPQTPQCKTHPEML